MSSPFPILQLPLLAQLEILNNMDPIDFLAFSLISRRSKVIARELKYPLNRCGWIFDEGAILLFPNQNNAGSLMKSAIVKLNGQDIRIFLDKEKWIIGDSSRSEEERLKLMDEFTEHIFTVFRFKYHYLRVYWEMDVAGCFVWKYTKTFCSLSMLDDRELQFVLEQLKVTELDVLCFRTRPRFVYDGPLTMDYLEIPNIDWISRESIRNMKCSQVRVRECPEPEKWSTMLKDWQQGGLANLEKLRSRLFNGDMDGILEGIESFDWNPEKRPKCWRNESFRVDIDLSTPNCKDITRADGTLATVKIDNESKSWKLFVWHPKYLRQ